MASKQSTVRTSNHQPRVRIHSYPAGYERLLELAEKRGYSGQALLALGLSAIVAHANRTRRSRKGRVVTRAA